jgi:tRNA nucleotidyltransferase/poly(A) polymerase
MKNLKTFLKESIEEYTISLLPDEVKHFKLALELDQKIKKKFPNYVTALVGGACRDLFFRKFFGSEKSNRVDDLDFSIYKKNSGIGLDDKELTDLMNFIRLNPDYSVVVEMQFLHLKVIHKPTGFEIEYTSARKEAYDRTSRKPTTAIGTLADDVFRRDFTVNAIYLEILKVDNDSVYVSPVGESTKKHIDDVRNKILTTTTENPNDAFDDDPLRVLRAVRFSGYSYDMVPKLDKAVKEYDKEKIFTKVARERVAVELGKILEKGDVDYLLKSGFITKIATEFSDFDGKEYKDAEIQHIIDVIKVAREKAPKEKQLIFFLSALLHDVGKGSTGTYSDKKERWQFLGHEIESEKKARDIMKRYKFSNPLIRDVTNLISQHMVTKFFDKVPDKTIIMWILKYDDVQDYPELIDNVLLFNTIDWGGKPEDWREKNKDMIKNEREIVKKVLTLREKIREIKSQYKGELSAISTEVGKDKNIPTLSIKGAILKRHANFILSKLKNS